MRKKLAIAGLLLLLLPVFAMAAQNVVTPDCGTFGLSCKPISEIIANFAKWILGIFGFLAIISFAIAGIQYLLASGDENIQQRAKRNVVYSIIGVVVGLGGLVIITAVQNILGAQSGF
jgi:hypothetical protein